MTKILIKFRSEIPIKFAALCIHDRIGVLRCARAVITTRAPDNGRLLTLLID